MNGKSFWSYCLWLMIVLSAARMAYAQDSLPLVPGQPQEQVLTGSKPIRFRIQLQKGQFMRALVTQISADLALELLDASEKSLLKRNLSVPSSEESLAAEAPADDDYILAIASTFPLRQSVKFTIRLETKSSVTNKEQALLDAEQLLHEVTLIWESLGPAGRFTRQQFEAANQIAYRKRQQAVPLYQLAGERRWEAQVLFRLCADSTDLTQRAQAAQYGEQALVIWREQQDRRREADTLLQIGLAWFKLTNIDGPDALKREEPFAEKSIAWIEQALAMYRDRNDQVRIGDALLRLGEAYAHTAQRDKRFPLFEQALTVHREAKYIPGQRLALTRLGNSYRAEDQYEKAVEYYEQVLALNEANNIPDFQGLQGLIAIYGALENNEKALVYIEKLLALSRATKNLNMEAAALRFLSETYIFQKRFDLAQTTAEQGLAFAQKNKITYAEGSELSFWGTLGHLYLAKGEVEKAIPYLERPVPIAKKAFATSQRMVSGTYFYPLAEAYLAAKRYDEAIEYHWLAAQNFSAFKLPWPLADSYKGLMMDFQGKGQTAAAIFWGKQAINLNQDIRRSISGMDEKTRKDFLKSREEAYRNLADMLISLGRLPEAEQVIRMLKEEEYYEYVRRDDNNAPTNVKTTMTPEEAALEKRFREIADSLIEIGEQRSGLLAKPTRSTEEDSLLTKLESDLSVANQTFQKFLDNLSGELSKKPAAQQKVYQLRESQGLMEDLRELGKGVAALYTLVGEEKFRVILTNADVQKAYEFPIKGTDLNRKVLAFRDALQNKQTDPRPAAQELYQILLGPVAKDLQKMKATTLMWSLDGVLRYVPIAALYDGEKYLVERYNNIVFTPASNARLKDAPRAKWEALGLGVTRGFENVPPLPAVADEMRSIIKDAATPNANGILPGTIKLDDQFTQEAMLTALRARPAVVHVASHFQFKPGNETNSALLLGDGKFLSLAQIKSMPNVFGGVELLTLSACNTATGSSTANGKEVEGFGVLAQRQGAKAVVASLWPVDDRTTRLLMEEFYRGRETNKLSKGDALRQAQLKLLRGELNRTKKATEPSREIIHEAAAPTLPKDTKRPFQHPYYWAPFIMIGNWR